MKTILIVDDNPTVRNPMELFLQMNDYHILTADNADKALEHFSQRHIDLMITNIMMPGMNGIELTRYVSERYDTKVIVATGMDDCQNEAFEAGTSEYVTKPIQLESFKKLIESVLSNLTKPTITKKRGWRSTIADQHPELQCNENEIQIEKSTKFIEKLSAITIPILEYGWIFAILLGVIYFLFPDIYNSLFVQLLIIIPIALILLTWFLGITLGVGQFVFKKYADEYERLISQGEDRAKAFAKTSLKALIVFIILLLLALFVIFKNIFFAPTVV